MARTDLTGLPLYRPTATVSGGAEPPRAEPTSRGERVGSVVDDVPAQSAGTCVVLSEDARPALMTYGAEPSTSALRALKPATDFGTRQGKLPNQGVTVCLVSTEETGGAKGLEDNPAQHVKTVAVSAASTRVGAPRTSDADRAALKGAVVEFVRDKLARSEYARQVVADYNRAYPEGPAITEEEVAEVIAATIMDRIESAGGIARLIDPTTRKLVMPPGTKLMEWLGEEAAKDGAADPRVLRVMYAATAAAAYVGYDEARAYARTKNVSIEDAYSHLNDVGQRHALAHARGTGRLLADIETRLAELDRRDQDAAGRESPTDIAAAAEAAHRALQAEVSSLLTSLRAVAERNMSLLGNEVRRGFARLREREGELAGIERGATAANVSQARAEAERAFDGQGRERLDPKGPIGRA